MVYLCTVGIITIVAIVGIATIGIIAIPRGEIDGDKKKVSNS